MFVEMASKALLMLSSHCLVNLLSSSHTGERYFTHPMFSQIKKEAEEMLVAELQIGIDSGFDHNFDYPEWLQSVKERYK